MQRAHTNAILASAMACTRQEEYRDIYDWSKRLPSSSCRIHQEYACPNFLCAVDGLTQQRVACRPALARWHNVALQAPTNLFPSSCLISRTKFADYRSTISEIVFAEVSIFCKSILMDGISAYSYCTATAQEERRSRGEKRIFNHHFRDCEEAVHTQPSFLHLARNQYRK